MAGIKEYFYLALRNLRSRSLRSWLTIFGIVIGVFLIISLLSLSEGIKDTISKQLKSLGGEMIFIMPGDLSNPMAMFLSGVKLEKEDLEAIKRTRGVDVVLTMSYQALVARYGKEGKMIFICGVPFDKGKEILERFQGWGLKRGNWPKIGKRELLVGSQIETEIFKEKVKPGSEFTIKGRKFEVVGILNSLGNKQDDTSIFIDMSVYQELTGEKKGTAKMAMVKIKEGYELDTAAENIKEGLGETRKRRIGVDEADFSVITSEKMADIAGGILAIIQFAVIAFASIAIVVGGIGITNTMFTSVKERTREIGIMKAVGAKNSAVLSIFLIEAGIIGIIGGLGGTLLGAIFAKIIEAYGQVHPIFYFKASISPGLIIFGLVFSLLVGCLSGFLPARKAAQLKPVEALRRFE